MKKIRVYEYDKCSTCRKAVGFLQKKRVDFDRIPIVEQPPTQAELKRMLGFCGGDVRKLFNTSGMVYREMGLGEKLDGMSQDETLHLLAAHGKLVKRPFVLTENAGLVGFKEEEWKKVFG